MGDTFFQGTRWLHLLNSPKSSPRMYARPLRLNQPVVPRIELISLRKDVVEGTNAPTWSNQAAATGRFRSGSVTERFWMVLERLRTGKLRRIAGSPKTHNGATYSLSTLEFMLRGLRNATNESGFWSCFLFGKLSRRNLNRFLRPKVPQHHVRLTWICVSTLL